VTADLVHEQGQRIGRDGGDVEVEVELGLVLTDRDLAGSELGPQVVYVERMLEREGLQLGIVDRAALLGVVQPSGQEISRDAQCFSFRVCLPARVRTPRGVDELRLRI